MMLSMIVDASALYAFFVRGAPEHWRVANEIELAGPGEELVVSPLSLSALEAMILPAFGHGGWVTALRQLAAGAWSVAAIDAAHIEKMAAHIGAGETLERASAMVLAEEHGTDLVSAR